MYNGVYFKGKVGRLIMSNLKKSLLYVINRDKFVFIYLLVYFLLQLKFIFVKFIFWDESVYIGIGKYIFSFGNKGLFESIRPIILSFFSGLFWFLNLDTILYSRLFMLLSSLTLLYVFYLISRKYVDNKMSLFAMIYLSLLPIYFIYSTKILTGIFSMLFVLLGFYFFLQDRFYLTSLFLGIATSIRFPSGIYFGLFSIYLFLILLKKKISIKRVLIIFSIFMLSISPYFIMMLIKGKNPVLALLKASQHQNNIVFKRSLFYYFKNLFILSPALILIFSGLYYCIKNIKKSQGKTLYLLFSLIIPFLYFVVIRNKQLRFLNLVLPFMILVLFYGLFILIKNSKFLFVLVMILLVVSVFMGWRYMDNSFESYIHRTDPDKDVLNLKIDPSKVYLTSSPVFVAYNDALFIPYYSNITNAYSMLSNHPVNLSIYSDEFPCSKLPDEDSCVYKKDKIISLLKKQRTIYQNKRFILSEFIS